MFNTTDEKFHAKLRRSVSNAYAMSTLVTFEPHVDSTSTEFLRQLKLRYADKTGEDGICDLGLWLQFYAFDVIGELTYSKRLGFVDHGTDVDNIISNLERLLNYVAVASSTKRLMSPIKLTDLDRSTTNPGQPLSQESHQAMAQQIPALELDLSRRGICQEAHGRAPRR